MTRLPHLSNEFKKSCKPINQFSKPCLLIKHFQHFHTLNIFIHSYINIFGVTETWLSHHIYDNEILPFGYTIYRKDRDSRGGGVLLAVNKKFSSSLVPSPPDIEVITTRFHNPNPFIICVTYIPPNSGEGYHHSLSNYFTELSKELCPIILIGDFNFPDIDWATLQGTSSTSNRFCELLFQLNFTQLIDQPTHIHGNILDLVITNTEELIHNVTVHPQSYQPIYDLVSRSQTTFFFYTGAGKKGLVHHP